jgi:hypothetical protein
MPKQKSPSPTIPKSAAIVKGVHRSKNADLERGVFGGAEKMLQAVDELQKFLYE